MYTTDDYNQSRVINDIVDRFLYSEFNDKEFDGSNLKQQVKQYMISSVGSLRSGNSARLH